MKQSVLWRSGIWSMAASDIVLAFGLAGTQSTELMRLYGIDPERPSSCKIGALDFINDYKFVLPVENMVERGRSHTQLPVYRCLIDENNPWQPSNGAHHAVELVLLFGGFDHIISESAKRTGQNLREKWIDFVQGDEPWPSDSYAAFGPHGMFQQLDEIGVKSRRRTAQVEFLKNMHVSEVDPVFNALAVGRISLLN
jgi:carboxylesterase type B